MNGGFGGWGFSDGGWIGGGMSGAGRPSYLVIITNLWPVLRMHYWHIGARAPGCTISLWDD